MVKKLLLVTIVFGIIGYVFYFLTYRQPLINQCNDMISKGDLKSPQEIKQLYGEKIIFEPMGGPSWEQCQNLKNILGKPFYYSYVGI